MLNEQQTRDSLKELKNIVSNLRDAEILLLYHAANTAPGAHMLHSATAGAGRGSTDVVNFIYGNLEHFLYNPVVREQVFLRMAERIVQNKRLPEFVELAGIEKSDRDSVADALVRLSDSQAVRKTANETKKISANTMVIPAPCAAMIRTVFAACDLKSPVSRDNVLTINTEIPVLTDELDKNEKSIFRSTLFERIATLEFLQFFWVNCGHRISINQMPPNIVIVPAHYFRYVVLINTIMADIMPALMLTFRDVYITKSFIDVANDPFRVIEHPELLEQRKKKGVKLRARLREMIDEAIDICCEEDFAPVSFKSLLLPRYNDLSLSVHEDLTDREKAAVAGIVEDNILHACAPDTDCVFPLEDLFEERMTAPLNCDPAGGCFKPSPAPYGANILVNALVPATIRLLDSLKAADKLVDMPDSETFSDFRVDRSIAGVKEKRIAEKDRKIEELSGIIETKDNEIQRLKAEISRYMAKNNELADRLNNLPSPGENAAVGAVEAENRALRERIAFLEKIMEKKPAADICAEGENGDIIIDILSKWYKSNGNSCRRRDIVGEFLKKNPASGNLQLRQERIRSLLKDYKGLTDRFKAEMKDLGINIELAGKHAKVYYGEDRERYVLISLTPSDPRSGKNTATSLIQLFT